MCFQALNKYKWELKYRIADHPFTILQASSWKRCHIILMRWCDWNIHQIFRKTSKGEHRSQTFFFFFEDGQKTLVILLQTWKCKEFGYISIVVQKEVSNWLNGNKASTNEDWQDQNDKHQNNPDVIKTQHLKDSGFGWLLKDLTVPHEYTPFRNNKNLLQKILLAM